MSLQLQPITQKEAKIFVDTHHRHHPAPVGCIFSVAINDGEKVVGVAMIGRPVARMNQNGYTAEVVRCCVLPGVKNGCSMLYGAAWRACRAMGYKKIITYTLQEEKGSSLRAAGWRIVGEVTGRSWNCPSRPRVDTSPSQLKMKFRWQANA